MESSLNQTEQYPLNNTESIVGNKTVENEQYSNYVDSSDIVVEYYKNQKAQGLYKYFLQIEDYINTDFKNLMSKIKSTDNKPLVLQAEEGVGKKTLLVKWMEYHQQKVKKRYPDIILPHFATTGGNNSNYFLAIYRFLIKLREVLDIKQKVELLEEKLRSYFEYWLGVCNQNLEKQVINDKKEFYDKVILLIEGINHFKDPSTGNEAIVAFWLPKFFPKHFRYSNFIIYLFLGLSVQPIKILTALSISKIKGARYSISQSSQAQYSPFIKNTKTNNYSQEAPQKKNICKFLKNYQKRIKTI